LTIQIDKEWVEFGWRRYRSHMKTINVGNETYWDLEQRLLEEVGTLLSEKRPIRIDELLDSAKWRQIQSQYWIEKNEEKFIEAVSKLAFDKDAANFLRHHILMILKGVGLQLASGIVTMYDRFTFTPLDARTKAALKALGKWEEIDPNIDMPWDHASGHGYLKYCESLRRWAAELGVDLRNLDRALYQWHFDSEASKSQGLSFDEWQNKFQY
jgi:hypothetical protein